jgi:hypothetical protein
MNFWGLLTGRGEQGLVWRGMQLICGLTRGLFEKKQFRAYVEFNATTTLKFTAAKPFMLTHQALWTGTGAARCVITTGSTESVAFGGTLATKFCKNLLDGAVAGNVVIGTGGTVTGGNEREVLRSDSSSAGGGSGNQNVLGGERLLPAGTYYMTITVTGTTSGMYSLEWEELDPLF